MSFGKTTLSEEARSMTLILQKEKLWKREEGNIAIKSQNHTTQDSPLGATLASLNEP